MAITRAQQYRQMLKDGEVAMQGSKKPAKNYLGKQKTVSGVPVKWQSGPDTPPTELAYITKKEKDLLLKADIHGSLKDGPNTGPDGIMSLDSQGDYTRDRSRDKARSQMSRRDSEAAVRQEAERKKVLTGQVDRGQTSAYKGPKGDDLVSIGNVDDDYVAKKDLKNVTSVGGVNQPFNLMNIINPSARRKSMYDFSLGIPGSKQRITTMRKAYAKYLEDMGITPSDELLDTENLYDFFDKQAFEKNLKPADAGMEAPMSYGDFVLENFGSPGVKFSGDVGNKEVYVKGYREDGTKIYDVREKRDGGQDQPIVPIVPTTTGIASTAAGTTAASDTSDLDDYIAQMREGAAYRFFADGGRVPAQQGGGIEARLEQLGGDVTSAEQLLQQINERLQSAESSLGSGGGGLGSIAQPLPSLESIGFKQLPSGGVLGPAIPYNPNNFARSMDLFTPRQMPLDNIKGISSPGGVSAINLADIQPGTQPVLGGIQQKSFDEMTPAEKLKAAASRNMQQDIKPGPVQDYLNEVIRTKGETNMLYPKLPDMTRALPGGPISGGPMQSPIAGAIRPFADGGRADDEEDYVGGIMDLESARQMYGLGKLVKKVTRGIKKIAKSPVGKIALLAGGAGLLSKGGFGLPSFLSKKGLSDFFFAGKPMALKNLTQRGLLTGIGGLSAFAGLMTPKEQEEDEDTYLGPTIDIAGIRQNPYAAMGEAYRFAADGGLMRQNYAEGSKEPVAKKTMPLLDMDGMEKDYRKDGGFVPIGRMERADDVPARLSKNEFVFTADAVRNAGDGDVDKGAEVMYNMMKNLEAGGNVSEESQGLDGARKMFQTSQRLEEVL